MPTGLPIYLLLMLGSGLVAAAMFEIATDSHRRKSLIRRNLHQFGNTDTINHTKSFVVRIRSIRTRLLRLDEFDFFHHIIFTKNKTHIYFTIAIGLSVGLGLAFLVYFLFHSISLAIGSGLIGAAFIARIYIQYQIEKFSDAVYLSLPQIVDGLIRCLKAGFDLNRSLSIIAEEVPELLKDEFRLLIRNRDLGQSMGAAMYQMANRLQNSDAVFLATLVATQEKSGGPLIDALISLSQILKDRERLRQKRRVASAEARTSATILGGLPVLVAAVLFSTNASYRETLLTTESGRLFLALGLTLLIIGSFVMARMIRIGASR